MPFRISAGQGMCTDFLKSTTFLYLSTADFFKNTLPWTVIFKDSRAKDCHKGISDTPAAHAFDVKVKRYLNVIPSMHTTSSDLITIKGAGHI